MICAGAKVWGILVAAGSGSRLEQATGGIPKQFLPWNGFPLYWHSVLSMARCSMVRGLTLVFPQKFLDEQKLRVRELHKISDPGIYCEIVAGGQTRQDSVRNGIATVPAEYELIAVHDAARPFLRPELLWRLCNAVETPYSGAIPGLEVTDTIKLVEEKCPARISESLPRGRLRAVQTPQVFMADALRDAHLQAQENSWQGTDDASLLEMAGYDVQIITGAEDNIKITNPSDLDRLQNSMNHNVTPCTGFGYDAHRYGNGRPLKIGGVEIPGGYEVMAHSDGDVLMHALIDAILGCAGLGDIGSHFPDTDAAYDDISSAVLLDETLRLCQPADLVICHADLTVVAQKPRLAPFRQEIRNNMARLLGLRPNHVNFKATTEEGLGFTGRIEGIKAYALVTGQIKTG